MSRSTSSSPALPPIAVVGVSAIFPGSLDATGFWHDILQGSDLITDVPPSHWLIEDYYDPDPTAPDKTYTKRGAFLRDIAFDALKWGVPPQIMPATDTSQLLALIVAQKVLEDASRGMIDTLDRSRISVILGVTSAQELLGTMVSRLQRPVWTKALREAGLPEDQVQDLCQRIADHYVPWQESTFPGVLGNVVAGRIANRLNLGGTNCVTDAACASTFSALSMAVNELQLGHSDMVISGGVDTMNDIFMYMCFSKTPAMSQTGDCRPFSNKADGTMMGEGLGMVALKRLEDAERDGDQIYALIKGVGSSSDGRSKSVYAPVAKGQAQALRRAYKQAGHGPETVELLEAHGTGTKAGDAAEFEGLRMVFDESGREDRQWCALGSVKSQIGHTKSAAGAAGLFKAVMALHGKALPPTLKIEQPNPALKLEQSPFHLNTRTRPWIRGSEHPRRASVSSFGFGGSNFHVVLEEYTEKKHKAKRLRALPYELVVLRADTPEALLGVIAQTQGQLSEEGALKWLAQETQREEGTNTNVTLAFVAQDEADAIKQLQMASQRIKQAPQTPFSTPNDIHYGVGQEAAHVAFLFPGQGSQYIDMGRELALYFEDATSSWDQAADAAWETDKDLHQVVFPPSPFTEEEAKAQQQTLKQTEWAQPAIGCVSLTMWKLLQTTGLQPSAVGGHSFGEVSALLAAGVLKEADFLNVSRQRGMLMAEAAQTPGAMCATNMPIAELKALLDQLNRADLVVANQNSPSQNVLSGSVEAIEVAEKALKDAGASAKRLQVATAFHSPIVSASTGPFQDYLKKIDFAAPKLPVYANSTANPYPQEADKQRSILAGQLGQSVRFVEQIEAMYASGIRTFVEVGPNAVLSGLVGAILKDRPHQVIPLDRKKQDGLRCFLSGLGQLISQGHKLSLAPLWEAYREVPNPQELPKPKFAVDINGANYGKLYPPAEGASALPGPNPPAPPKAPEVVEKIVEVERVVEVPVEKIVEVPVYIESQHAPQEMETMSTKRNGESTPTFGALSPRDAGVPAHRQGQRTQPHMGWVTAFQEAQAQTASVHASYQQAMAETHMAFLRSAEASIHGLTQMMLHGASDASMHLPLLEQPQMSLPPLEQTPTMATQAPVVSNGHTNGNGVSHHYNGNGTNGTSHVMHVQAPAKAPAQQAPAAPTMAQQAFQSPAPTTAPTASAPAPIAPVPTAPVAAPVAAPSQGPDLQSLMMEVVAEKTGYPAEMLTMEMELESDLGIDSIKRVEILSAMQEKEPTLPEVDTNQMAALQTLGEIVGYMQSLLGSVGGSVSASPAPLAAQATPPAPVSQVAQSAQGSGPDLQSLMMEVVAEKTGYPAEMLTMEMELESDLGIDSIKRVEILSAMQEKEPTLPEVDTNQMAALQTLGQIVEYMQSLLGGSPAQSDTVAPQATQSTQGSGPDLQSLMMDVVAEKTGYPAEMLTMEMELESDLGIDSIKRVEILSAMQEKEPTLPEVDTNQMAALQTLGQIVEYMQSLLGGSVAAVGGEEAAPFDEGLALGRTTLQVVDAPALNMRSSRSSGWGKVLITDEGTGIAQALAHLLQQAGVTASVHPSGALPAETQGVIFLGGLRPCQSPEEAISVNREGFVVANALANTKADTSLFVSVQDTGGQFGVGGLDQTSAYLGGLAGLTKTAAQEWRGADVKAIDLERASLSADALAARLYNELLFGGPLLEVGLLASGRRITLHSVQERLTPGAPAISSADLIVVSGGARGVTAATMIALAKSAQPKLVLLGRTALQDEPACCQGQETDAALKRALLMDAKARGEAVTPAALGKEVKGILANREIRQTLTQLQAAGSKAQYLSVDVTNTDALSQALAQVRQAWGPITGLIHGAGVLADKLIAQKTVDQFDWVFSTKVNGWRAMQEATQQDPIRLIAMFSSVAGRCGNIGQSDYAMANEVLNKVAQSAKQHLGPDAIVKSLGWGPWEGGMVTPALKARFDAMQVPLIPLEAGGRMLVNEFTSGADVELVLGAPPVFQPLLAEASTRTQSFEIVVNKETHSFLEDHAIHGQPVVPVVLVVEWMSRVAQALHPDLNLLRLEEIKVLRGIILKDFAKGETLLLDVADSAEGTSALVSFTLRSPSGALHYKANAVMQSQHQEPSATPGQLTLQPWRQQVIYDGDVLFHGPAFQVIQRVDGMGQEGTVGWLETLDDKGQSHWQTDVPAFDGGLQLAVLWAKEVLGGATLPTGIEQVRFHQTGLPGGPLRCLVKGREQAKHRTLSDVSFIDSSGQAFATFVGLETHIRPS